VICEGRDDAKEFASIRSAMKVLTYSDQEIADILRVLAALLHLGNLRHRGNHSSMLLIQVAGQVSSLLVKSFIGDCLMWFLATVESLYFLASIIYGD